MPDAELLVYLPFPTEPWKFLCLGNVLEPELTKTTISLVSCPSRVGLLSNEDLSYFRRISSSFWRNRRVSPMSYPRSCLGRCKGNRDHHLRHDTHRYSLRNLRGDRRSTDLPDPQPEIRQAVAALA